MKSHKNVWDNKLGINSRVCLIQQLPLDTTDEKTFGKSWEELPEKTREALLKVDWEMCLGRRLTPYE